MKEAENQIENVECIFKTQWKTKIKFAVYWVKRSSTEWIESQHFENLPMKLFLLHSRDNGSRWPIHIIRLRVRFREGDGVYH